MWIILQMYLNILIPNGVPSVQMTIVQMEVVQFRVVQLGGRPKRSEPFWTEEQTDINP